MPPSHRIEQPTYRRIGRKRFRREYGFAPRVGYCVRTFVPPRTFRHNYHWVIETVSAVGLVYVTLDVVAGGR